jgi:hypothetical protein
MVRTGRLSAFALALAVIGAAQAYTQAPAHAQYSADPETVEADETEDMPDDGEPMFEEPVDLTTPFSPAPPGFDPSKFLQGLPSPVWTATAGINDRDATPNSEMRPGHWPPGMMPEQTVGVAWANVTAPGLMVWDRSAIETRVDPYQQTRFGVTLSRSVPVGSDVAVTLQNGFAWTQPLLQGAPIVAHGGSNVVEGNHAVRFTLVPADTTLSIGATGSTAEDGWRRSLSAEQRLFGGPVSITGGVSETSTGEFSRSLKAGFKRNW